METRTPTGDGALDHALRLVVERGWPEVPALCDAVTARIVTQQPEMVEALETDDLGVVARATEANIRAILSTLGQGVALDGFDVPAGAMELLDHLALDEAGLPVMLRAYRLGAAGFNELWVEHLAGEAQDRSELAQMVVASLAHVSAYVDRISEVIVGRWSAAVEAAQRDGRRREAAIRALVRGEPLEPSLLDHPVDVPQLVVAWCDPTGQVSSGRLAAAAGAASSMDLELADDVTLTWLAAAATPERVAAVLGAAEAGGWLVAAGAAAGLAGLRRATADAREGLDALRRTRSSGAVEHAEVAFLTTLLADEDRARRLVEAVLGPLAADAQRAVDLRETLRAYFEVGERKTSAAALLGIHEKTVAHRLARAEELLGHRIADRRVELGTALLLHRAVVRPGAPGTPTSP